MRLPVQPYESGVGSWSWGILYPVEQSQPPAGVHSARGPQESELHA